MPERGRGIASSSLVTSILILDSTFSMKNYIIGVACIVEDSKGQILVGYDGNKKKWAFPGGHWEGEITGETYEEAALREIYEETGGNYGKGLKCRIKYLAYEIEFYREDQNHWYKSFGFVGEPISGELGDDLDEKRTNWQFLPVEKILELDLFEPARKGLLIYLKKIGNVTNSNETTPPKS